MFINKLLAARRELVELGCTYVDRDVFCLGRLKESLTKDTRFQTIGLNLSSTPNITWEDAVKLVTTYEMTISKGTTPHTQREEKKEPTDVVAAAETIRRLQNKFGKDLKKLNKNFKNEKFDKNKKHKNGKITCYTCGKEGHKIIRVP